MKKKLLTVFVLVSVMLLGMMSAVFTGCSDGDAYPNWNVSAEGSSVTASFSDDGKYGYILTVEGSGAMKDFSSANDAPWYDKSGRVTELLIGDGVTGIGNNAFTYCYAAESVVLPASVTAVGKNAFPASTKVYAYSTDITVGDGATVYVYSENQPTTSGNFWRMVNGVPTAWPYVVTGAQKVLFIGNSYTFYNAMPLMFERIAAGAGVDVTVEYITTGSQSLINWANPETEDGARVEEFLTASSDYDIIVLQEKSTSSVNNDYRYFLSGAQKLADRINQTQEDCRIFMYETWGSPAYASSYGGSVPAMEERVREAYEKVADRIGAEVSYVGKAFSYIYENYPEINLYNADKTHPSFEGSFLAASVHAATLLGINPENSTYNGEVDEELVQAIRELHGIEAQDLAAGTAAILKETAQIIATGAALPEISYDMQIAVYSRYADASVIADLVAKFREYYATEYSETETAIKYYLLGASNTAVAAFGELVKAGSYDIILASGNNINSENGGGVTVIEKKSYKVVDSVYPAGGERYISRLTENEVAIAFYRFMDTDAAKKALDPNYVPEVVSEITVNFVVDGEPYGSSIVLSSASSAGGGQALPDLPEKGNLTPMGWALTEQPQDGEIYYCNDVTYATFASVALDGKVTLYARYVSDDTTVITINIAVFKRYVNESTIQALIAAFKESYSVNENEVLNVTYELLGDSSTSAGNFGALVNAGNFNITFGSGSNIITTGGVTSVINKNDDVYVADCGNTRTVAYLTDDDATLAFYNFISTDTAKKILNPAYVPEGEADEIEVIFDAGEQTIQSITLSNATDAKPQSLPEPAAEVGYYFKGWALTQTVQEGDTLYTGEVTYADLAEFAHEGSVTLYAVFEEGEQTITLVIGYYVSSAIDEDVLKEIETAFGTYAAEHGFEDEFTITFKAYTGMNGDAGMNTAAQNKEIDYSINTGNAITEANGIPGTKQKVGTRYVMQIANTDIAALFHSFALQDTIIGSW